MKRLIYSSTESEKSLGAHSGAGRDTASR